MDTPFFKAVAAWLSAQPAISGLTLFGSVATGADSDDWSDLDFHVITSDPAALESGDWVQAMPEWGYRFLAVRPATGGVRKATVVFARGQIDLVIVPVGQFRLERWGWRLGLHRWHARLADALNEISTCLMAGYRVVKGEETWGAFYSALATGVSGVRVSDAAAVVAAEMALVDALWVRRKAARGELVAAQHVLHSSLVVTNLRQARERELRRGHKLRSFGLGRHVEQTPSPDDLAALTVNATCSVEALTQAVAHQRATLIRLMAELVPAWQPPLE